MADSGGATEADSPAKIRPKREGVMRVLSAILLAATMTGAAAGQVVNTAPVVKQGPSVSGLNTGVARPVAQDFAARIKSAGDAFHSLKEQIDSEQMRLKALAKQRAEIASQIVKARGAKGKPDDKTWQAQQQKQMQSLDAQLAAIDQKIAASQASLRSLSTLLGKLNDALEQDRAAMRRQIDQARQNTEQQQAQKPSLSNFEIQQLTSQYNEAETLASSVQKKQEDTDNSVVQKIGD
jgi:hypothetical protein